MCTSLDPFPACIWHDYKEYNLQVCKEVEAAINSVKMYSKKWPEMEWEKKDLGSLCVIVPNRHVVSPPSMCAKACMNTIFLSIHINYYIHGVIISTGS